MKRFFGTMLVFVCTASAAFAAEAQEETKALDTVVVTAGRVEEKAKNVTQSMTVISQEEIAKSQYQDLGHMLKNYGVQVNSNGAANESFSQIAIRGMRTPLFGEDALSAVLVLIDGRRAGTSNISMIPMVSIERIEIIRGPASVQYGGSAIGGVVNVITKRGGKDLKASAEVGYGSWETWKSQAGISGSRGPVDFAGGVSWTSINGDYKTGHGHRYKNTQLNNRTSYALNTGVNFLEEHRLGISLIGTQSDRMGNPSDLDHNSLTYTTDRSNHSVDAVYDGGYKAYGLQWKARYYAANDKYVWNDPAVYGSRSETKATTQGSQGQLSWKKGFLTLTGGLDWTNNSYRQIGTDKAEYDNLGGFLLAKAGLFEDKLILSAGLRYDEYSLAFDDKEKNLDNTSPSIGLAWHALDWLTFRANYGESYRVPAAREINGYNGTDPDTWLPRVYHGNPDLTPEKGIGWDAGFEINYKALTVSLTYFQTDYNDKIIARQYEGGPDWEYYNISGSVDYRGVEGLAGVDIGEVFDWPFMLRPYVAMTHLLKYEDQENNAVPNVRNTDLAYGITFQYPSIGLEADLRFTYFGHQKESKFDPVTYAPEEIKTGGETTADFFISKTIADWEEKGSLSLKGAVYNIFDVEYSTIYGYPMPGRSFYIGLRYDY